MPLSLTVHGHACVRLERDGAVLVVDPGSYSDRSVLADADAVLVTHEHADHVVAADVVDALAARPGLQVWAPAPVVAQLTEAGADAARVHAVAPGAVHEYGYENGGEASSYTAPLGIVTDVRLPALS